MTALHIAQAIIVTVFWCVSIAVLAEGIRRTWKEWDEERKRRRSDQG